MLLTSIKKLIVSINGIEFISRVFFSKCYTENMKCLILSNSRQLYAISTSAKKNEFEIENKMRNAKPHDHKTAIYLEMACRNA